MARVRSYVTANILILDYTIMQILKYYHPHPQDANWVHREIRKLPTYQGIGVLKISERLKKLSEEGFLTRETRQGKNGYIYSLIDPKRDIIKENQNDFDQYYIDSIMYKKFS